MTSAASDQPATVAAGACLQDSAPQPPLAAVPPATPYHHHNYRNHFPPNNSRLHGHRNHNYHQHHHHHNHHHNHNAGFMPSATKGPVKGSQRITAAAGTQQQVPQPAAPNDFRNACSSSASSSSMHSSDCSSANSISAGQSHRPQQHHHPLPLTTPPGPPYYVDLHVNAGEVVSLQLFGGQEQLVAGPTTVTMISQQQNPPVPIPVQVPPGHMIHQIADENGILKHIILSLETDDGPQLDSTVINLPQGPFRMDPTGELVSAGAPAATAGGLTNLPDQTYFANYDGYRAPSVLVMGNNYPPVYSGYEQHNMPTTTTMDARVTSTNDSSLHLAHQTMQQPPLVASGYRLTDSGDIDNYNNQQHMPRGNRDPMVAESSGYNGHGGKSYSQASARHSEMKRQQYQSTSSDKQTSPPVSSGKYTNSTNVKVISNNHIASNKIGVQSATTAYHHHNLLHQQQHLNNNSNSNSNQHHHHHNNNQQHHHTSNQAQNLTTRASKIKGSPHNQSIQNTGKQQQYGTSNLNSMHNAKDYMLTANHQTNFQHSNSSSAILLKTSNNNNDSISSNNGSCNNSLVVHEPSESSANKIMSNKIVESDNKNSPSSNKPRDVSSAKVVESNSTDAIIHKSKSFDNSSLQDNSSSLTKTIRQQILTTQESISGDEKHILETKDGSETSRVNKSLKDKSISRGVSLSIKESEPVKARNASIGRTCGETSTCQENTRLIERTSRGKQKCHTPQNSHSQDEKSSNQHQPTVSHQNQSNPKTSSPIENLIRKRTDVLEIHETSVKTTTPEVHSISGIVGGKSRRSGISAERQQKGNLRSTKDKPAATKQTSETIEAMRLDVATMIACDKKDKSDSPTERVDTIDGVQETAQESPFNIQPATKVKAIKVAADEQRNSATSADIGSQINSNHQAKHKNQKHNITSNNFKTMDIVVSNKQLQQQHEQQLQPMFTSKKSKNNNGSKQVVKKGRQNNQSLKELHQLEQQADTSLVLSSTQSTSFGGHRGYPSSHSSSNSNHHNHQNGSSSAGKSSAPQPVKLSSLIRQCRTKVARLLVRLVKSSLSSCSDTKFVTVLLILFTCIATLLAMCIHSFIAAPVTE